MEAFTAVQTVSSIVQLVEFGSKCLKNGLQLYRQSSGVLDENLAIEATAIHLSKLNNAVMASVLTLNDATLKKLCDQINPTIRELLDALGKLKVQGVKTKWKCMRKAIESVWGKDKLATIELKLKGFRDALNLDICVSTRIKLEGLDTHIISRFDECDARTREILDTILKNGDLFQTALNDHSVLLQGLEEDLRALLQTSQVLIQQDIRDAASHIKTVIQDQHSQTRLIVREEGDRVIEENADSIRKVELHIQSVLDGFKEEHERMHQQTQEYFADQQKQFVQQMQKQIAEHLNLFDQSSQKEIIGLLKEVVQLANQYQKNNQAVAETGQAFRETTSNSEQNLLRERSNAETAAIVALQIKIADVQKSLQAFKIHIVDWAQWTRTWSASQKTTTANVSVGMKFEAHRQLKPERMDSEYSANRIRTIDR